MERFVQNRFPNFMRRLVGLPEVGSVKVVIRTCKGNITARGPTVGDANALALGKLDYHNSEYHLANNTPFCHWTNG
ncbi:MAG: hypothetical protein UR54_C0001G0029 [Candidatus Roizmanbacteria bacterium GW2011_GWA2_34_18]|uniref:Uncharacterized protein n=1 Tax=Candidatus Roizmanbacteria bacterium GW2011_GWA2_34_18 TaxID=1618477 RepID=A0A0G0AWS2_9BACT|nr:MAG: hypothetical protein UR54_C0001G0029 [Candidatus Roizmanbacteria bacterium GW2011_GWA2_34_18]